MTDGAKKRSKTNRVVFRGDFVHAPDGSRMRSWGTPHSVVLDSRDEAFERTLALDPGWFQLDFAWVTDPVAVWLRCIEGAAEVGLIIGDTHVRPLFKVGGPGNARECGPFEPCPESAHALAIRSVGPTARVLVVAVPR